MNSSFKTPNDLHQYLNTNPPEITHSFDIASLIKESIEKMDPVEGKESIEKLDVERAVLSFVLEGNNLKPRLSNFLIEGQPHTYPSIDGFTEDHFVYIEQIFEKTNSHIIETHYGHFLWIIGRKHTSYIDRSIEGYSNLIHSLLSQVKSVKDNEEVKKNSKYHIIRNYLAQLIFLSQRRRNTESVRQIIIKTLNDPDHEHAFYSLALLMLETKKVFNTKDFESIPAMCLKFARNLESPFEKISFFNLGIRLDDRLHEKSFNWKKLIAEQYEFLAKNRTDLACITFANKAARYYEEAGETELAEEMALLYKEKSDAKELGKIQTETDISDYVKHIDDIINALFESDIEQIFIYLITSPEVIPHKKFIEDMVLSMQAENSIRYFIGNQIYDSNGHIAQHFNNEEEITYMVTLENYHHVIRLRFEVFINRLFVKLLEKKDWSAENIINKLGNTSWYGHDIQKSISSSVESVSFKIIQQLKPGLVYYFQELNKWKNDKEYTPDFTLPIDSLVLKMEGILREICKLIGVRTFYIRRDEHDREVTKEKDINMLLREKKLISFIGEDLNLFLKSLLVERVGDNLRNKVAHSFLVPNEYKNFTLINKIIIALFKLSSWEVTNIEHQGDSEE